MIELNDGELHNFLENQLPKVDTKQGDNSKAKNSRELDLSKMKSADGCNIHLVIGMVDFMKSPEKQVK